MQSHTGTKDVKKLKTAGVSSGIQNCLLFCGVSDIKKILRQLEKKSHGDTEGKMGNATHTVGGNEIH